MPDPDRAAESLATRRSGQFVQVPQQPGEDILVYIYRAALVNQALLFADMLNAAAARRERGADHV